MSMVPMDPNNPFGVPEQPMTVGGLPQFQLPAPKKKKGGMFGGADWGSAVQAAMNGWLAAGGNQAGMMGLQQMHQQRQLKQRQEIEAQQYQQERNDKRDDFVFEQDYRAQHPGPINNDTVNDYQFVLQQRGQQAADEWLQNNVIDRPVVVQGPNGPVAYRPSQLGGGQSNRPPLGIEIDDPRRQGGPAPQAPGGFLGSR